MPSPDDPITDVPLWKLLEGKCVQNTVPVDQLKHGAIGPCVLFIPPELGANPSPDVINAYIESRTVRVCHKETGSNALTPKQIDGM